MVGGEGGACRAGGEEGQRGRVGAVYAGRGRGRPCALGAKTKRGRGAQGCVCWADGCTPSAGEGARADGAASAPSSSSLSAVTVGLGGLAARAGRAGGTSTGLVLAGLSSV